MPSLLPAARSWAASALFALALACGGPSAASLQQEAEAALAAKDYPTALAKVDAALALADVSADKAQSWRFESLRLDAFASGGQGAEVKAALERLSAAYDAQLTAALYRSLADKLRAAGDGTGAVDVLDAGAKKFPNDPSFAAAIDDLKKSADPAEIERLKALGYL